MNILGIIFGSSAVILSFLLVNVSSRIRWKSTLLKKRCYELLIAQKMLYLAEREKEELTSQIGLLRTFEPNFGVEGKQ